MAPIILTLIISLTSLLGQERKMIPHRGPKWRKIVLTRSTREDVEKLLGQSEYRGFGASYAVEGGTLRVIYYPFNRCSASGAFLRVPQWTVVEMTYDPDNPPSLAELKLDLKKFRQQRESPHVPELISYINNEKGVEYTFQGDNTLSSVRYFPPKRYNYLRCQKPTESRRKT